VDMALLIRAGLVDRQEISEAIHMTFLTYGTHPVPDRLTPPPEEWRPVYDDIVKTMQLPLPDISGAFKLLDEYWRSLA